MADQIVNQNLGVSNIKSSNSEFKYVDPNNIRDITTEETNRIKTFQGNKDITDSDVRSIIAIDREKEAGDYFKFRDLGVDLTDAQTPKWLTNLYAEKGKNNTPNTSTTIDNAPNIGTVDKSTAQIFKYVDPNNIKDLTPDESKLALEMKQNGSEPQMIRLSIAANRDNRIQAEQDALNNKVQEKAISKVDNTNTKEQIFNDMVAEKNIDPSLRGSKQFLDALELKLVYNSINNADDIKTLIKHGVISENSSFFKTLESSKHDIVAQYRNSVKPVSEIKKTIDGSTESLYKSYSDAFNQGVLNNADTKKKIDDLKKSYGDAIASVKEPDQVNFSKKFQEFYNSPEYLDQKSKVSNISTQITQLNSDRANLGKYESDRASATTPLSVVSARIAVKDSIMSQRLNELNIILKSEQGMLDSKLEAFKIQMSAEEEDQKNKMTMYDKKIANVKDIFQYDKYALDLEIESRKEDRDKRFQLTMKDIDLQNSLTTKNIDKRAEQDLYDRKVQSDKDMEAYKYEMAKGAMADDAMIDTFVDNVMLGGNTGDVASQIASSSPKKTVPQGFYTKLTSRINQEMQNNIIKYGDTDYTKSLNIALQTFSNKKGITDTQKNAFRDLGQLYWAQDKTYELFKSATKGVGQYNNITLPGGIVFNPSNLLQSIKANNANDVKAQLDTYITAQFGLAKGLTGDSGALSNQDMDRIRDMLQKSTNPDEVNKAIASLIKGYVVGMLSQRVKSTTDQSLSGVYTGYSDIVKDYYGLDKQNKSDDVSKKSDGSHNYDSDF